jgi:hypothetical protein
MIARCDGGPQFGCERIEYHLDGKTLNTKVAKEKTLEGAKKKLLCAFAFNSLL